MKYIDTHAHYIHRLFNQDRHDLLRQLLNEYVKYIIECGTNEKANADTLKLASRYDNIYAVIGFFPQDTRNLETPGIFEAFQKQLQHPKVIGLGEIGLDYYHPHNKEQQQYWFKKQLELAREMNLPVCIHSRNAEQDTNDILVAHGPNTGVIHCYAYGPETMKLLAELGYYFGVGGTSTYKNNTELREAIRLMPLDRIVLETDCPFLSPAAVRRERNDSSKIAYIVDELAQLKNVTPEEIIAISNANVKKLYPKMFH